LFLHQHHHVEVLEERWRSRASKMGVRGGRRSLPERRWSPEVVVIFGYRRREIRGRAGGEKVEKKNRRGGGKEGEGEEG
jgi:hypothetical protein